MKRADLAVALDAGLWPAVRSYLTLADAAALAPVARNGSAACGQAVDKVRVTLLSEACQDDCCRPPDWNEELVDVSETVQLCNPVDFLNQPCGSIAEATVMFAFIAEEDLFGLGLQNLLQTVRQALPFFLSSVAIEVDAVRDVQVFTPACLEVLQEVQPRVLGTSDLAGEGACNLFQTLVSFTKLQVLVMGAADDILERDGLLHRYLSLLPHSTQGLDFHFMDTRVHLFPVALLPKACTAFGTVLINCISDRVDTVLSFPDFMVHFPVFPARVRILRLALGVEMPWVAAGEVIASAVQSKFPGVRIVQLELSLIHSTPKKGVDISDLPFISLVQTLLGAGIRVEVTTLQCRAHQFEFLRAALDHSGAAVHQLESTQPVYPFSHPQYSWPSDADLIGPLE